MEILYLHIIIFAAIGFGFWCLRKPLRKFWQFWRYKFHFEIVGAVILVLCEIAIGGIAFYLAMEYTSFWQSIFFAITMMAELLTGGGDELRLLAWGSKILRHLVWGLSIIVPFMTASTILALVIRHIHLWLPIGRRYYIFSQMEQHSITLARDIQTKSERGHSVFLFLRTNQETIPADFLLQLRGLRYRVKPYGEEDLLKIHFLLKYRFLRFYFMSENTDENFQQLNTFLEIVKKDKLFRKNRFLKEAKYEKLMEKSQYQQELYLFAETYTAPMLIDLLRKKLCTDINHRNPVFQHTELHLVDRNRILGRHLMQQVPLYETAQDQKNHVLVLGLGRVGSQVFRAAVSSSAMLEQDIKFTLAARDIESRKQALLQLYPRCDKDRSLEFISINMESDELDNLITSPENKFTYIVVCLGDDELNIKIASRIKRVYRKEYWEYQKPQPKICVNVEDDIKSKYTRELFSRNGASDWDQPLYVFGSDHERFSAEAVMPRGAWIAAQMIHSTLKGKRTWEIPLWSEYERRSSLAAVYHAPYHIASVSRNHTVDSDHYSSNYEAKQEALNRVEHKRWSRYVECEGMESVDLSVTAAYYSEVHNSHVDIDGQLTPCLVDYDDLDELYHQLCEQGMGPSNSIPFPKKDQFIARNADIIYKIMTTKDPTLPLDKSMLS